MSIERMSHRLVSMAALLVGLGLATTARASGDGGAADAHVDDAAQGDAHHSDDTGAPKDAAVTHDAAKPVDSGHADASHPVDAGHDSTTTPADTGTGGMDATMTTGTGPGTTTGDADMMSIVVDAAPTADAGFPTLPFDASTPVTTITDASNDAGATPTLSAGCRTSPGRRESGDALLFALGVLGVVATGRISRRRQR